jgi:hypothetical protein
MVRKFVEELKEFDNIYYEICNEPYFGGVTIEWQHHIADVIAAAQKSHPHPKLIAQNIANNQARVENPHPAVSIFNFHYAAPPDTVSMNYQLNKVIGDNETGFRGTNDTPYRSEGWDFIIAGGGLYNNLDYSFTVGHEDGTFDYPSSQPGGGNPGFRKQMRVLRDFINGFDFVHMKPGDSVILSGVRSNLTARVLSNPGKAYAIYLGPKPARGNNPPPPSSTGSDPGVLELNLPAGNYRVSWIDPVTGSALANENLDHTGGMRRLTLPKFREDVALGIRAH